MAQDFTPPDAGPEKNVAPVQDVSELPPSERQRYDNLFEQLNTASAESVVRGDAEIPSAPEPEFAPTAESDESHTAEEPVDEAATSDDSDSRTCQRCGFDTTLTAFEPDEDDRRAFVRSLLGGSLYEKEFKLFDGSISVKFRVRTTAQGEMISDQMNTDVNLKRIESDNIQRWFWFFQRYQLACSLISITRTQGADQSWQPVDRAGTNYPVASEDDPRDVLMRAFDDKTGEWPQPLLQAILQVHRTFEEEVDLLTSRVQDSDFWTSVGAA